jgi:hypothetical protein
VTIGDGGVQYNGPGKAGYPAVGPRIETHMPPLAWTDITNGAISPAPSPLRWIRTQNIQFGTGVQQPPNTFGECR